MDGELQRSILAASMLLAGLATGYAGRKSGLLKERLGKPLHFLNIIAFQANICWLTMWGVTWRWGLIRLPIVGLVLSLLLTVVGFGLGRLHGFGRRDRATFALCCGMSNLGSTGGLLVIRVLISDEALQLGLVFLLYWSFYAFLFCFPLAKHFGGERAVRLRHLLASSVVDVRMLPLVGMFAGLALAGWGPPRPDAVRWIVYGLILASGFMAMFAIGVTLHLRRIREFVPAYLTQGAVKFLVAPALMFALAALVGLHGIPRRVVLVQASMSQAFYSVMIANLFGLNVHLANSMFLVNTLTFLVVVFPLLAVLM